MSNDAHFTDEETVTQRKGIWPRTMPVLVVAGWGVVCPPLPLCPDRSHYCVLALAAHGTLGGASPPGGQSLWWSWRPIQSFIGGTLQQTDAYRGEQPSGTAQRDLAADRC